MLVVRALSRLKATVAAGQHSLGQSAQAGMAGGRLVNTALKEATPAQMKVLEENYARKDKTCEQKVKQVFVELGLEAKFRAHEEESNKILLEKIAKIQSMPTTIFTKLLGKIYKRKK